MWMARAMYAANTMAPLQPMMQQDYHGMNELLQHDVGMPQGASPQGKTRALRTNVPQHNLNSNSHCAPSGDHSHFGFTEARSSHGNHVFPHGTNPGPDQFRYGVAHLQPDASTALHGHGYGLNHFPQGNAGAAFGVHAGTSQQRPMRQDSDALHRYNVAHDHQASMRNDVPYSYATSRSQQGQPGYNPADFRQDNVARLGFPVAHPQQSGNAGYHPGRFFLESDAPFGHGANIVAHPHQSGNALLGFPGAQHSTGYHPGRFLLESDAPLGNGAGNYYQGNGASDFQQSDQVLRIGFRGKGKKQR